jgi:hypothetical protein
VKARHIAQLIDLVAGGAMNGAIQVERAAELNAALWELAMRCDEREEVHAILQAQREAEMDVAIGRLGP